MDDTQKDPNALLDTTDCLEAISVFKGWKNMVFTVVFLALLVLQAAFWLVNNGAISLDEPVAEEAAAIVDLGPADISAAAEASADEARSVAADSNMPVDVLVEDEPVVEETAANGSSFELNFRFLSAAVNIANATLILAAMVYCLCILFCLKISLVGRLGGINHICRAFFMSLIMLVLVIPWQKFFGPSVPGAIWYPDELRQWADVADMENITRAIMYFLRFVGYWLLVFLFLISAQIRSVRWTRSILRRLEVI